MPGQGIVSAQSGSFIYRYQCVFIHRTQERGALEECRSGRRLLKPSSGSVLLGLSASGGLLAEVSQKIKKPHPFSSDEINKACI